PPPPRVVSPRGGLPRPRAGDPGRRRREPLLADRPRADAENARRPGLPRRTARGRDRGRADVPRRLRPRARRERPHRLRRFGHRVLVAACRGEERHVPDGGRRRAAVAAAFPGRITSPQTRTRRPAMADADDLLARGRAVTTKLWGERASAPDFPAARLAPEFFKMVTEFCFGMFWSRPNLAI